MKVKFVGWPSSMARGALDPMRWPGKIWACSRLIWSCCRVVGLRKSHPQLALVMTRVRQRMPLVRRRCARGVRSARCVASSRRCWVVGQYQPQKADFACLPHECQEIEVMVEGVDQDPEVTLFQTRIEYLCIPLLIICQELMDLNPLCMHGIGGFLVKTQLQRKVQNASEGCCDAANDASVAKSHGQRNCRSSSSDDAKANQPNDACHAGCEAINARTPS